MSFPMSVCPYRQVHLRICQYELCYPGMSRDILMQPSLAPAGQGRLGRLKAAHFAPGWPA
jgi:hypothetical protein